MMSSGQRGSGLLNKPPLIKPERMPDEIIRDSENVIKTVLVGYKKSGLQWDDYANKLEPGTREVLQKIFFECRCNGFMNPHIENDAVCFQQMLKMTTRADKYELTPQNMRDRYEEN
jgi:hypothetical protein